MGMLGATCENCPVRASTWDQEACRLQIVWTGLDLRGTPWWRQARALLPSVRSSISSLLLRSQANSMKVLASGEREARAREKHSVLEHVWTSEAWSQDVQQMRQCWS